MSQSIFSLEKALKETIEQEALLIKEEIVKSAVVEFEKQLRRAVGNLSIDLSNYFSTQVLSNELVIRVKIESGK